MKVEDFKVGERVHDIGWGADLLPVENGTVIAITKNTVKVQFDDSEFPFVFMEDIDLDFLANGEFVEQVKEEA